MVVYVQIGKNPRMAINSSVKEIRTDFIEQMKSWKRLVPVYFYPNSKTDSWTGVLIPYAWRFKTTDPYHVSFYWIGQYEYWYADERGLRKVDFGTVGWDKLMDIKEKYMKKGYEF